jgi:hypothetical protein
MNPRNVGLPFVPGDDDCTPPASARKNECYVLERARSQEWMAEGTSRWARPDT